MYSTSVELTRCCPRSFKVKKGERGTVTGWCDEHREQAGYQLNFGETQDGKILLVIPG